VARRSDAVCSIVPDSPEVEQVVLGENGLIQGARPGAFIIEMSTIDPAVTQSIARRVSKAGLRMIDAPVCRSTEEAKRGELLMWEKVKARVLPVTVVEDPQDLAMKLQLMSGNVISQSTALRGLQIDTDYEARRKLEEAQQASDLAAEEQKRQQEEGTNASVMASPPAGAALMPPPMGQPGQPGMPAMGAAPAGALPPAAQPGQPGQQVSLDDMLSQADQMAQQIMTMDPVSRRQQLVDLKHSNEALHAQVISRIEAYEQQAATMGVQAARQGGQAPTM
jgi:hypothetical protein